MLGTLNNSFPGLDRGLGESIALMDLLQFRDRRDLTDQPPQPRVARRGKRAIIGRHRIVVHKGKGVDGWAQLVMRAMQQRQRHDIGGRPSLGGIESRLAEHRPAVKADRDGQQQKDSGKPQERAGREPFAQYGLVLAPAGLAGVPERISATAAWPPIVTKRVSPPTVTNVKPISIIFLA